MNAWLFVLHLAATWYMVGLIWFVQLVHYPMMSRAADFEEYERVHQTRTTWAVGPVMLLEASTLLILLASPPFGWNRTALIGTGVLLLIIWLSTAAIQVPCHEKLSRGFDAGVHQWLVQSNWIRTVAWSARGIWLLALLQPILASFKSQPT